MIPNTIELESILAQLIAEHERMLQHLEAQQAAMKKLDLKTLEDTTIAQESSRLRIATLETRRRVAVASLAKMLRLTGDTTLPAIAAAIPQSRARLLALRERLKALIATISTRTHVASRLAGALLGHLNTVVRLLAGAVEQAGLYTKHGTPKVSGRIGVMEAVG